MVFDPPRNIVWTDDLLARFWSYYARFPELYFSHQCGAAVVAAASQQMASRAAVLDYGCGPGYLLPHLLDAGYLVTGTDLTHETMGDARKRIEGREGFEGLHTIDKLLSNHGQFSAVFLLEVIEHLSDSQIEETLNNVHQLLLPGGVLVITTPNEERLDDNMVYCPVSNVVFHRWQHVRSWSRDTLAACLQQHGFSRTEVSARTFSSSTVAQLSLPRRLLNQTLLRMRKPQSLFAVARP